MDSLQPKETQVKDYIAIQRSVREDTRYRNAVFADTGRVFCCVYTIGWSNIKPIKIGMADDPIKRCMGLQTGNPYALFVHDLVWVEGREDAELIEKLSHDKAEILTQRFMGEWFDISAEDAIEIITDCCIDLGINSFSKIPRIDGVVSYRHEEEWKVYYEEMEQRVKQREREMKRREIELRREKLRRHHGVY